MGDASTPDLLTARLRLCAMTRAALQLDEAGDYQRLGALLGCSVGREWPPENWEPHVFPFLEEQLRKTPEQRAWQRYILLRGEPDVLVGNCNAFLPEPDEAELGYGVLPEFQRRGIATEATARLLTLLQAGGLRSVRAHTFAHLPASIRVLERCGLQWVGDGDEGTVRYRICFPRG